MIKFESEEVIRNLDNSITNYNNQFYKPEDVGKKLPYYDEEKRDF